VVLNSLLARIVSKLENRDKTRLRKLGSAVRFVTHHSPLTTAFLSCLKTRSLCLQVHKVRTDGLTCVWCHHQKKDVLQISCKMYCDVKARNCWSCPCAMKTYGGVEV
jgi:hypothetical protein